MPVRAFVIGHPIAHSRSPLIHRYWLDRHGIEGSYEAFDIAPRDLDAFLDRVRAGEFAGGNVTIPHKRAVFAACDRHDAVAREIGAVNTLVCEGGMLAGRNTDRYGFLANLDAACSGWDEGAAAIVLGAGGGARAVLSALKSRGFAPIHVLNRTPERADALAGDFGPGVQAGPLSAFSACAERASIVVNTTSIGMQGTAFDGLDLAQLPDRCVVTDLVYDPLETPLLAAARQRGLRTVDGLGMLLHQAVPGFAAWFGVTPDVTEELRALVVADVERAP